MEAVFERDIDAARGRPGDPVDVYQRLRGEGACVLLDAAGGGHELERRAYVLPDPVFVFQAGEGSGDPLTELERTLRARLPPVRAPTEGFRGGAVGFLAYDLARRYLPLESAARPLSRLPHAWFALFDHGIEIDPRAGRVRFFARPSARIRSVREAESRARALERALSRAVRPVEAGSAGTLRPDRDRGAYERSVAQVIERILSGDVYQVNLSQRFAAPFSGDPLAAYARLRSDNPAPYAAFLEDRTATWAVACASPERFLLRRGRLVETRPIKGTRRRTGRLDEDRRARGDLVSSTKERRELAMVVDLERNDLARVAEWGSVRVVDPGRIEAFATVFHRTAVVQARAAEGVGTAELLRAVFPGGSVTGTPKLAAMSVIERLEPVRRGVFTGAIGWIAPEGDLELAVVIRTIVFEGSEVHFHVGGGIVLGSDPAEEYVETLVKGDALARALGSGGLLGGT